jgi:tetratricopeptide (TPR) repeat protein
VAAGPARIRQLVDSGDFAAALDLVRHRIAGDDDPEEEGTLRLLEARLLDRMGQVWEALRVYRRIFDQPTVGPAARAEAHELYVRRGEFASADRLTEAVADALPGADPGDLRRRAYSRSVQGEYRDAARLAAAAARDGDGQASVLEANALLALGERERAESLLLSVLEGEDSRVIRQAAHFGLGQAARLRGGRAIRAMQDEKAVLLGPAPWAELDWGLALRALGRREEARSRLRSAAKAEAGLSPTVGLALARLDEEEGKLEPAVEHLAGALDGSVADFLAWTRLGDVLLKAGNEEEGIRAYRTALELFPGFPPAGERLSRALVARGRWDEAPDSPADAAWQLPGWTWDRLLDGDLPFYEAVGDAADIPPSDPRRLVLALVQLRAGFPAGAIGWAQDGQGLVLASIRAEALERVGRGEDAAEAWEALLASGADSPVAMERLALLAFAEDPDRARERWAELFEKHPEAVRARIRMAKKLEEAEQWEEALKAYEAAETGGWLSPEERRRIRVAREDLEAAIQEREEARAD